MDTTKTITRRGSSSISNIEKVFRVVKEGEQIAFLTMEESGGIYKVIKRIGIRGIGGTITLHLQNVKNGHLLELDMRRDAPNIAVMGLLRERKKRVNKPKVPTQEATGAIPVDVSTTEQTQPHPVSQPATKVF